MHVVGEGFHIGELAVGVQHARSIALPFPCVVDVDVDVPSVFHAGSDHLVSCPANVLSVTFVAK